MAAQITMAAGEDAAAELAADMIAAALQAGIAEKGWGVVAVSGGRSPLRTFERLSEADLDWTRIWITLVDERWIEPWSPESNERLVRAHLLQGPAKRAIFLPMKTAAINPLAGAGRQVRAFSALPKPLDAVVLGMGEDGHFASLFPRSPALNIGLDLETTASCVAVPEGENGSLPSQARMSLTLHTIAQARTVLLLTSGPAKKRLLERALNTLCHPYDLPIAALLAARPDTAILHYDS